MVECSLLRTNPNDMFGLDMVGVLLAEVFGVLVFGAPFLPLFSPAA